jgi:hypothetical protein
VSTGFGSESGHTGTGAVKGLKRRGCVAVSVTILGLLGFAAAPSALAARGHVFGSEFGWGVKDGKSELQQCSSGCQTGIQGAGAGQLDEAEGIAVNETTGNVYVADKENNRVDEFESSGVFVRAWGWGVSDGKAEFEVCTTRCQAGSPGDGGGRLWQPRSIAVDNDCAGAAEPVACRVGDPSAEDVYVSSGRSFHEMVAAFTVTGAPLPAITGPPSSEAGTFSEASIEGLATNGDGDLYALVRPPGDTERQGVDTFEGKTGDQFAGFTPTNTGHFDEHGLAVDATGDLYVRYPVGVAEFDSGGVPLDESVGGLGKLAFNGVASETSSGDVYLDDGVSLQRFGPFDAQTGANPFVERVGGVLSSGTCDGAPVSCGGVAVNSRSGRVFVVAGGSGLVQVFVLEPPTAPTVTNQFVSKVTASSARLQAEINPRSESFEPVTTWSFQYVSEAQYDENLAAGVDPFTSAAETPAKSLAANYEPDPVTEGVSGLAPGTSYRYRLVAENALSKGSPSVELNEHGEEVGRAFTTQPTAEFGLLDGRGWELVSPPDKQGALLEPRDRVPYLALQAAAEGGAVTYIATAPTEVGPAGSAGFTQVFSSRTSTGGWGTRDLVVPHVRATAVSQHPEWPLFSDDLSLAAVQPLGPFDQGLSPLGSEQTAYLHSNFAAGSEFCTSSCYTPLVTAVNAPGGEFGIREQGPESTSETCPPNPFCGPQFEAGSPDLRHVVVHSRVALVEPAGSTGGLFEVSGGALTFLGTGAVGGPEVPNDVGSFLVAGSHMVSADGSRVVITGEYAGQRGLLLRDTVTGETLKMGGPQAMFVAASADDSKVFFTSSASGGLLEECDVIEEPGGELHCDTIDVSGGASVDAPLPGVSENGESVYFVSGTASAGVQPGPNGETARAGQPNLYLSKSGVTSLVAVLFPTDASDWGLNDDFNGHGSFRHPEFALAALTARVSPDGQWLAFLSERGLTGYDTNESQHGQCELELEPGVAGSPKETGKCREVYLYHAPVGGEPASLVCASCDPTGERPSGSASIPGWTNSLYQSRYLSDGGRLFFNTPDQLVPQDTNNQQDVYEYEPAAGGGGGTGSATGGEESPPSDSCTTSLPSYSPAARGCVDLISSGSSPEPSTFLDASENGDEVFFLTTAQLSKRDTDTSYDVYDASVGGSEPEPAKPVECQGDACQTPVAPPENLTPGSLTFTGPGNQLYTPPATMAPKPKAKPLTRAQKLAKALAGCKKDRSKSKRAKCQKQARKAYGAKTAGKRRKR